MNIVQIFSCTKKLFLIYLNFIQFPPYVGPGATFLHALGINYVPRIRNKLFTDVSIAIVSQFLWRHIRSILLIKSWNTLKVYIQYLNIQRDKWVKLILSSKPSLPSYNSLSGGSWQPQHWWLPSPWCGERQGGCCFAFLLLAGEAIGENPPRRVNSAFVIVSWGSCGNLGSSAAQSAEVLPFTGGLFPWEMETGPKSSVALDSVGRAQHWSVWETEGWGAPDWCFPARDSSRWGWKVQQGLQLPPCCQCAVNWCQRLWSIGWEHKIRHREQKCVTFSPRRNLCVKCMIKP